MTFADMLAQGGVRGRLNDVPRGPSMHGIGHPSTTVIAGLTCTHNHRRKISRPWCGTKGSRKIAAA